tara:strand:+ start:38345 stop:38893 length:549 start_codon:yes stop_codon:yes gene_type:complete
MKKNDYATFLDNDTLKLERVLPGPIETVWACLTESQHKREWLSGGDIEPKVGGKVTHHFDHREISDKSEPIPEKYKEAGDTTTMYGKVLVWEPYTLLSYTWDEGDSGISEVTFELSELEKNQVKLVLIHTKVPDSKDFKVGVSAGWHTHLNILRNRLEGKKPGSFWSVHMLLEEEYENLFFG